MPTDPMPGVPAEPVSSAGSSVKIAWDIASGDEVTRQADRLGIVPLGEASVVRLCASRTVPATKRLHIHCSVPCHRCTKLVPFRVQYFDGFQMSGEEIHCSECKQKLALGHGVRFVDGKETLFVFITSTGSEPLTRDVDAELTIEFVAEAPVDAVATTYAGQYDDEIIRHFFAADSHMTDEEVTTLREMKSLQDVVLRGTKTGDRGIAHLADLPDLLYLDLRDTRVTDDGLKQLSGLSNLRCLRLDGTRVTGRGLKYLRGCQSLRSLSLGQLELSDDGFEQIAGLVSLDYSLHLTETPVTDKNLMHLLSLKKLQVVHLTKTQLDDAGAAVLGRFHQLHTLDLEATRITDAGLEYLKELKQLKFLRLMDTKVTDEGVNALRQALPETKINY